MTDSNPLDALTRSRLVASVLATLYIGVGLALFYGLLTAWYDLVVAALVATLVVVIVSLLLVFRTEGVFTRENRTIAIFVVLAIGAMLVLSEATAVSSEWIVAAGIAIGVLAPMLVLEYGRRN